MAEASVRLRVETGDSARKVEHLTKKTRALEKAVKDSNEKLRIANGRMVQTGRAAATATGNIQRMGVAFRTTLAPIVAVYGAINILNSSLNVAADRQKDVATLTNGLRKLGGTQADIELLAAAADRLGKATLFDEEDFTKGFTLLTSFQRIGIDSYERVAKAAADVAQVTGQDVRSALLQLSKALEDPARRVTDLARSGTVFTDQQKEQIKTLQESGRLLEAQNLILLELEKQYGNAATAAGSAGLAGAQDTLGEATRDLQEAFGELALPATTASVSGLAEAVGSLVQPLKDVKTISDGLKSSVEGLGVDLSGVGAGMMDLAKASIFAIPGLGQVLSLLGRMGPLAERIRQSTGSLRDFGANYASQERALFMAAGGFLPARNTPTAETPTPATTTTAKTPKAKTGKTPAERQSEQMQRMAIQMQNRLSLAQALNEEERRTVELNIALAEIKRQFPNLSDEELRNVTGLTIQYHDQLKINDDRLKQKDAEAKKQKDLEDQQAQAAARLAQTYQTIGDAIKTGVVDSLTAAVEGTKSLAEVASNTLRSLANTLLKLGINAALGSLGGGDPSSIFTKLFGGARANGGTVTGGRSYLVGERGPELFTPGRTGSIAPNDAMGGSSSIVVNVDATGSTVQGDAGEAKQLGDAIGVAIRQELLKQKRPGGLLA